MTKIVDNFNKVRINNCANVHCLLSAINKTLLTKDCYWLLSVPALPFYRFSDNVRTLDGLFKDMLVLKQNFRSFCRL
jgi:hypothetical protein